MRPRASAIAAWSEAVRGASTVTCMSIASAILPAVSGYPSLSRISDRSRATGAPSRTPAIRTGRTLSTARVPRGRHHILPSRDMAIRFDGRRTSTRTSLGRSPLLWKTFHHRGARAFGNVPRADAPGSAHVFDDFDEFVQAVAVVAGELDQFLGALDDDTAFGCPGDRNATPASELEESFIA